MGIISALIAFHSGFENHELVLKAVCNLQSNTEKKILTSINTHWLPILQHCNRLGSGHMERSIFTDFQELVIFLKIRLKQLKGNIQDNIKLSVKYYGVVTQGLVRSCLAGT